MPPMMYVQLVYLGILFTQPAFGAEPWPSWLLAGALAITFALLFARMFASTDIRWARGVVLAGFLFSFLNSGASVFYVYAAYLYGLSVPRHRLVGEYVRLVLLVIGQGVLLMLIQQSGYAGIAHGFSALFVIIGAAVSMADAERSEAARKLRTAYEEVEQVATIAERERIARDMHDVLGHTLSVVVLKAELAGRLLPGVPDRAAREVADIEKLARQALKDVRTAIAGYRSTGLEGELANARLAFEAAGIGLDERVDRIEMSTQAEVALAMVLREAVTNVIRHSGASRVEVELREASGVVTLVVSDDGAGGTPTPGGGLAGMRQRIETIGGTFMTAADHGFELQASVPVDGAA